MDIFCDLVTCIVMLVEFLACNYSGMLYMRQLHECTLFKGLNSVTLFISNMSLNEYTFVCYRVGDHIISLVVLLVQKLASVQGFVSSQEPQQLQLCECSPEDSMLLCFCSFCCLIVFVTIIQVMTSTRFESFFSSLWCNYIHFSV